MLDGIPFTGALRFDLVFTPPSRVSTRMAQQHFGSRGQMLSEALASMIQQRYLLRANRRMLYGWTIE
jgi:hypothetical protein